MSPVITFIVLSLFLYAIMITAFIFALMSNQNRNKIKTIKQDLFVSIIIAARNEEHQIKNCLNSLQQQDYDNYEIIIVDDHSEDKTRKIVSKYAAKDDKISLCQLPDGIEGKKNALIQGVSKAGGEFLFFTDADCELQKNHLSTMISYMHHNEFDMLCGPVDLKTRSSFWGNLQRLEFMSLIGSTAAGFFLKTPFMCNGANYLAKRSLYIEAQNKLSNHVSSGDDVFLLHYAVSQNKKTGFISDRECIVKTGAPDTIADFFWQRVRWASKAGSYKNPAAIMVSFLIFLSALVMLLIFALIIFQAYSLWYLISIIIVKTLVDTAFLMQAAELYKDKKPILFTPFLEIFHPFYIIGTVLGMFLSTPAWKGRKIKR